MADHGIVAPDNDDQRGPYLLVHNFLQDIDPADGTDYGPWRTMHVPVPEKLWLAPEAAERKGGEYLWNASEQIANAWQGTAPFASLSALATAVASLPRGPPYPASLAIACLAFPRPRRQSLPSEPSMDRPI
jgi:hypothetical protein